MVNFYIYYNTHTHTFINIKNNNKPETIHWYWLVQKYIIPLVKSVKPPVRDWLPYFDLAHHPYVGFAFISEDHLIWVFLHQLKW